jgi:hypothetical protein
MHPSASWKIVPIFFQARAVVLAFFIWGTMWCHSVQCFGVKMVEPAVITTHDVQWGVITLAAYCWSHCDNTFMFALLCSSANSLGTQWQQAFWYANIFIISYMALCQMSSCTVVNLTVSFQSSVMSMSTFCLLHSVLMVLSRLLRGRSAVTVSLTSHTVDTHERIP